MQVLAFLGVRRNGVDVEIVERGDDFQIGQTHLFGDLAPGRRQVIHISKLEVSAGLEPALELPVEDQEQASPVRAHHEPAGSEVAGLQMVASKCLLRRLP